MITSATLGVTKNAAAAKVSVSVTRPAALIFSSVTTLHHLRNILNYYIRPNLFFIYNKSKCSV